MFSPQLRKCELGAKFGAQTDQGVRGVVNLGPKVGERLQGLSPRSRKCERGGKLWTQTAKSVKRLANLGPRLPNMSGLVANSAPGGPNVPERSPSRFGARACAAPFPSLLRHLWEKTISRLCKKGRTSWL